MERTIRPMTKTETMYCYAQSQQISMQTGLIGHLRADMDTDGYGFFSDFFDFREDLKTEDFKTELDDVITAMRCDDSYGGVLKDRNSMSAYCWEHPENSISETYRYHGLRADTPNHTYMIRLNPVKGEYNLYCYCYKKTWLDQHLHKTEKGIRFIDSQYKELFRITDGDRIRIQLQGGGHVDKSCRYVDDYHVEVGNDLYHICEFAEHLEQIGSKVIPLRSDLPEKCFSLLPSSGEIIEITKGMNGYILSKMTSPTNTNREIVDLINKEMGITKGQESAMLVGSMFGWETPAADPKSYKENGQPIISWKRDRSEAR